MDKKQVTDLRSELLDSRFGAKSISTIAESKRFPLHEMRDDVAFQIINDELYLDGNARQNLATFCQTWDDDNVHKLMDLSINKNWIDKEEYPQSAAIDLRCVNMVADLWHVLEDYKASLKYLSDHPKLQGIAQQNSFKHT